MFIIYIYMGDTQISGVIMRIRFLLTISIFSSLVLLHSELFSQDQHQQLEKAILSGKVSDGKSGEPLLLANVYLANTKIGASSDEDGFYLIRNIPPGVYDLIVSYVGYKTQKRKVNLSKSRYIKLDFKLEEDTNYLDEIIVIGKREPNWKDNLAIFTREFLGTSQNSRKCRILNPEILSFKSDDANVYFRASSDQMLKVENRALGYNLNVLIENFNIRGDVVTMVFHHSFEEIEPSNDSELKSWEKARLKAYLGSFRHFLKSLLDGSLRQEGFNVQQMEELLENDFDYLDNIRIEPDSLYKTGRNFGEYILDFDKYLRIQYRKEIGEKSWRLEVLGDRFSAISTDNRALLMKQISYIKLLRRNTVFNYNGILYDPFAVKMEGYWGWERAAEILPWDYFPPESEKIDYEKVFDEEELVRDVDYDLMYREAENLREKGDFREALVSYEKLYNVLKRSKTSLPGLGFSYMDIITEKGLKEHYEKASELYVWGLSGKNTKNYVKEIVEEAERILPLIKGEEADEWRALIKANDKKLAGKIRGFWLRHDPTPTTPYNERLIEHWKRIAYARKHYRKTKNSVYKTDDRGTIYIKYGEPDRSKSGFMGSTNSEYLRWANFLKGLVSINGSPVQLRNIMADQWYPEYDVWVYENIGEDRNGIFIFGKGEGEPYKRIYSIDELIPNRAFAQRNEYKGYVRKEDLIYRKEYYFIPGSLLQIMYYSELMLLDDFFNQRYMELESRWIRDNVPIEPDFALSLKSRYIQSVKNDPIEFYAPAYISETPDLIENVKLHYTLLRILDDKNKPKLAIVAMSYPGIQSEVNLGDIVSSSEIEQDYELIHTLQIHDQEWNFVDKFRDVRKKGNDNTSVFIIDHETGENNFILSSEAKPKDKSIEGKPQIGKAVIEPVQPLKTVHSRLEISDIITGVMTPEELRDTEYPFPVIPAGQFQKGDPLMVYLEAYHLSLGQDGNAHFEIEFSYEKTVNHRIRDTKIERVSQIFSFDSEKASAKETAGFDISDLEPGEYEFIISITDITSGQKKSRKGKFRIAEIDER